MILTTSTLRTLNGAFNSAWMDGLNSAIPELKYLRIANKQPSTKAKENLGWLDVMPGWKKREGERQVYNLKTKDYEITHDEFTHTFAVKQTEFEDDNIGWVAPAIAMQAQYAAMLADELVWMKLLAGFGNSEGLGFDGQYFFDSDHPGFAIGSAREISYSNVQAGTGAPWCLFDTRYSKTPAIALFERLAPEFTQLTKPTDDNVFHDGQFLWGGRARYSAAYGFHNKVFGSKAPLNADNYAAARLAMSTQGRPDGKPMAILPNLLVYGPSNEAAVLKLINSDRLDSGASNPWYKSIETLQVEWLG